jgi:hypothetical protein
MSINWKEVCKFLSGLTACLSFFAKAANPLAHRLAADAEGRGHGFAVCTSMTMRRAITTRVNLV